MDVRKLMIGDWVVNTEFEKNVVDTIEIVELRRVWLTHGRTYIPFEFIEPVPLTSDILEKNGFKHGLSYKEEYFYEDIAFGLMVSVIFWENNTLLLRIDTCSLNKQGVNIVHNCDIKYVHELQHAMRLCGIDKEIVI